MPVAKTVQIQNNATHTQVNTPNSNNDAVEPEVLDQQESVITLDKGILQVLREGAQRLPVMERAFSLKMKYKKFETKGEKCRGIFIEFRSVPNQQNVPLDSVVWMEETGEIFYHSGVILVGECRKANIQRGMAIEIEYLGKKKNASDFAIYLLAVRNTNENQPNNPSQ